MPQKELLRNLSNIGEFNLNNLEKDNSYIYIGDLSRKDAGIIQYYASRSKNILEFGVGGSSQIFAQCCDRDSQIISIDTNRKWIEFTKKILSEIKKYRCIVDIDFMIYNDFIKKEKKEFDLIFNDGLRRNRLDFVLKTWSNLKSDGGILMLHDTRKENYFKSACKIIETFYNEIDNVQMNVDNSNISIITKKSLQKYEDWNLIEKKEDWMKSAKIQERPNNWMSILRNHIHNENKVKFST